MTQKQIKKELQKLLKIEMKTVFGIFTKGQQLTEKKFESILKKRLQNLGYKSEVLPYHMTLSRDIAQLDGDIVISEFTYFENEFKINIVIIDKNGKSYCTASDTKKVKKSIITI